MGCALGWVIAASNPTSGGGLELAAKYKRFRVTLAPHTSTNLGGFPRVLPISSEYRREKAEVGAENKIKDATSDELP